MASKKITNQTVWPGSFGGRGNEGLSRKPRLLFLAHSFPPARAISSVRTWNTAKYLARLGWDITVVTPHPSVQLKVENLEETEANLQQEGIRSILTGRHWRCLSPHNLQSWNKGLGWYGGGICRQIARLLDIDRGVGWIKPAEQACSILEPNDVDIILATGSPFATFKLAKRLADRFTCPFVLDYRDLWTGNLHTGRQARLATIRDEAKLLVDCSAVTIVSPSWGLALERRFGLGSKLHIVSNGYDPEDLAHVKPLNFGHFAIVYTGTFYPPKRVITPIMAALKRLKEMTNEKDSEWYFHYYGTKGDHVRAEAEHFGVIERVVLHGEVPRAEALSAVRGASVAVVITSITQEPTLADQGMITGKVFEAIGLGTPILLVAPSHSDTATVAETTGLARHFTANNIEGMVSFLIETLYGRTPKLGHCDDYAWPNIAKKMDHILRTAMESTIEN